MSDNPPIPPSVSGDPQGLKPGEIFWNHYRVIGAIGKGGVSTVYKAENTQDRQLVAIKVLHAQKSRDEELVRRFVRECQTTSKLDHPHAIRIFEWGIDQQERPFMIIEYLSGDTLGKRIQKSQGLACLKAVEIMEQVSSAIAEAHSMGIVHRDLKPDNIMLTTHNGLEDWVKVVDFGIAKIELSEENQALDAQPGLTRAGAILGTPLYMSPEQLLGRKADARSDIYALGIIMYEMLTGKPPFVSKNAAEVVVGHLNQVPESPSKVRMDLNIPEDLSAAVMRALAKNPWERPTTVQEFSSSLLKALEKKDPKKETRVKLTNVPVNTPTPQGMVIDPVIKVCPNCKTRSTGSNYRYCLKCGQDITNKWLPYHKVARNKVGLDFAVIFDARTRRLLLLAVLGCLLVLAGHSYLNNKLELTGKFMGKFDHALFANQPGLNSALAKKLQFQKIGLLLSQQANSVITGLIDTKYGHQELEGKAVQTSPMLASYEMSSSIPGAEGKLDLEMTGTYDKILRSEEWTVKAFFKGPKIKPISDFAKMQLSRVKESPE